MQQIEQLSFDLVYVIFGITDVISTRIQISGYSLQDLLCLSDYKKEAV